MLKLTPAQAEALRNLIQPRLAFLVRLRERMEQRGAVSTDKLYQLVRAAENALHSVYVEVHYLSCEGGTGRPSGS
ncbi:MAG TPA: hypothetical protein VKD90_02110 [Gemmataceae bacterium]|nr:hypothetical protein [Gemmataceae bacterium]